jgi:hypothetical protein
MTPRSFQHLAFAVLDHNNIIQSEALPASFQTSHIAHLRQPAVYGAARRVTALYVFTRLPNARTTNAMIATQNAYLVTYSIGVNVLTIASTAMSTEITNTHIDGA